MGVVSILHEVADKVSGVVSWAARGLQDKRNKINEDQRGSPQCSRGSGVLTFGTDAAV